MPDDSLPLAVILAGGLGTRIRHLLPNIPKSLAPVGGRPFLEWVVRFLHAQGATRIVFSIGYLGSQIEEFAKHVKLSGLEITCVHEAAPLGTAGALAHSLENLQTGAGNVLVCNGDSLALVDLRPLTRALAEPDTGGALIAVHVADASRYGTVDIGGDGTLKGFSEKRPGAGLVNAGIYLLRGALLDRFPERTPLSLEYDIFPSLLGQGARLRVVPCTCPFLDIGTEASLSQAEVFVRGNMEWFG
jgi:D-glycero-alpha-D-manno-heptose 1-phosphate guanylyltransferase